MMKVSDELIQGFALGEAALSEHAEEVIRTVVMKEDEAWVEPRIGYADPEIFYLSGRPDSTSRQVKERFAELLDECPELTRGQAYIQAIMEVGEATIEATYRGYAVPPELAPGVLARLEENDNGSQFGLMEDCIMMEPLTMRIIAAGEEGGSITFPHDISREDFERMKGEIQEVIVRAELRGEQKAMAFLMGEGSGEPVGIVDSATVKARIGNLDGWRYCTMKVAGDDKANLD